MKYLEWNNIISAHFFNAENAGKEVHLYLTKTDIIQLARQHFNGETEQEIWDDFLNKIKYGLPGSSLQPYIVDKAIHSYQEWKKPGINRRIEGVEIKFPPYIGYLVFFVLPLIGAQDNYNSNNYYDRLDDFLTDNGISQNLRNRLSEIENLWADLSNWANSINNGEIGYFRLRNFIHQNWIYVGKVFSQCVFPPKAIKRLPELFLQAGMIPDSNYSHTQIRKYLLDNVSILQLPNNTIDAIRRNETNELGQSIIETARKEYGKWTGESHSIDETGATTRTRRNDISARIYLQFQLFTNAGRIEFSFRLKSANEFPEDLNFNGNEIREEKAGYSKTMNLPFKETFQLRDDFNKWVAKFPDKDVRLFMSAGSLQFSNDYWIETDTLSKAYWMYLLCKNSKREKIFGWLKNHCSKFEDETEYADMPDGYSLFKILNPKEGLDDFPELTIIREKNINLVSALEFDFRTFTNDFLPEGEIINSDGTELAYLQYKNSEEKYSLKKKLSSSNRWLLPEDISLYADFNVRAERETFKENETTYKIISSNDSATQLVVNKLPKRDSFGRITNNEITQYSIGSNTVGSSLLRQYPYIHIFRGTREDLIPEFTQPIYTHSEGNILLSFLSLKGTTTAQDFYSAFEFLHSKYFGSKTRSANFNYTKIKKASLNFFDYLGYLDYDYETKSIVVNPPQLIFIPANKGRKVLLIGGRDASLVNSIIEAAPKHNLQVEITRQFQSNEDLLLPDAITIKSFGTSRESYGEKNLNAFANELKIKFSSDDLVQVGLQHFCSDIQDYEKDLFANKETNLTYEDWARYLFNEETLQLDKSFTENFDKNFSLLEYRLRPWEFYHRLWINQKCYDIDKNWGKYVALKHHRKNVILYDSKKEKVAIPLELPLPRLLAESIMLLSGLAPIYANIEGKSFRIYENIPSVFIQNLFSKLKQKTNNDCNF